MAGDTGKPESDAELSGNLEQRFVSVETKRLILETLTLGNMSPDYFKWLRDPEVVRYLEVRHMDQSCERIQDYVQDMLASADNLMLGMFLKKPKRHIGNIKLGPVNWRYRRADVGLVIGDKDCWGKGYASEAIDGVCHIAFNILTLRRVEAGVYASNKGSIKSFLNADFTREGILKGQWILDGQPEDHIILGRLAHNS